MKRKPWRWMVLCLMLFVCGPALAADVAHAGDALLKRPEVQAYIRRLVDGFGFDENSLRALFSKVRLQPGVISTLSKPAEVMPWDRYRALFLTAAHVRGGIKFQRDNAAVLERARQERGVPGEIVSAIIGVETRYGRNTGGYRVMDILTTLAFDYPKRADFFRGELEAFLMFTKAEGTDPFSYRGSYAGAMGMPQFMPSSYTRFAVDFDEDGRRDIHHSTADSIGSVAYYLSAYGWRSGEPVAVRAKVSGEQYRGLRNQGFDAWHSLDELKALGITPEEEIEGDRQALFITLETAQGPEYWLGFRNFYVITRYNHSTYYAMAIYQLSREITLANKSSPP